MTRILKPMMVAAALAAFALPTLALADPGGRDRDEHRSEQRWDNRDDRRDDRRDERRDERRDDRHNNRWDNRHYDRWSQAPRYYTPPPVVYGYGAPRYDNGYRHWQRGQYVSPRYRSYVIYDYGNYRLRPPPRGYRWVRVDNDYLLVAIATGLIFDVIINDR